MPLRAVFDENGYILLFIYKGCINIHISLLLSLKNIHIWFLYHGYKISLSIHEHTIHFYFKEFLANISLKNKAEFKCKFYYLDRKIQNINKSSHRTRC